MTMAVVMFRFLVAVGASVYLLSCDCHSCFIAIFVLGVSIHHHLHSFFVVFHLHLLLVLLTLVVVAYAAAAAGAAAVVYCSCQDHGCLVAVSRELQVPGAQSQHILSLE